MLFIHSFIHVTYPFQDTVPLIATSLNTIYLLATKKLEEQIHFFINKNTDKP